MKYTLLALLLTGCVSVPVTTKWPEVPTELKEACAKLEVIKPDTKKLSVVVGTVVNNYALYHECRIRVEGWVEWYDEQKKVHDTIK